MHYSSPRIYSVRGAHPTFAFFLFLFPDFMRSRFFLLFLA